MQNEEIIQIFQKISENQDQQTALLKKIENNSKIQQKSLQLIMAIFIFFFVFYIVLPFIIGMYLLLTFNKLNEEIKTTNIQFSQNMKNYFQ